MASRKTINVREILDMVNHKNKHSVCSAESRKGTNSLLESVLHATGNYDGFNYLLPTEVPEGQLPGCEKFNQDTSLNVFPDDTRRVYYIHRNIRKPGE